MPELYPLRFDPILKEKIWGGNKLSDILNKRIDGRLHIGESWEVSAVESDPSVVSEGPLKGKTLNEILLEHEENLVGKKVFREHGFWFPLLFKFIDANDDLSIQVHPQEGLENSKTEMWYIIEAEKGSSLYSGFASDLDADSFKEEFEKGNILKILNKDSVKKCDGFFLPSGRIHSIGKGMLLAEIQQNADTTYRLYDFERRDIDGSFRELHVEEGSKALDFSQTGSNKINVLPEEGSQKLIDSKYFNTRLWKIPEGKEENKRNSHDSFLVYMVLEGIGELIWGDKSFRLSTGQSILVPAEIPEFSFKAIDDWVFIETWVP